MKIFRPYQMLDWIYIAPVTKKLKTDNVPKWFSLLHNDKQINKCLVFRCSPLTFAWYLFFVSVWLNLMYCFVLSMRIIYDDSKNRNNYFMIKISIVVLMWSEKICDYLVVDSIQKYVTSALFFLSYRTRIYFLAVYKLMISY